MVAEARKIWSFGGKVGENMGLLRLSPRKYGAMESKSGKIWTFRGKVEENMGL